MNNKKQVNEMATIIYSFLRSDTMSRALASLLCGEGFSKRKQGEWIDKHCSNCGEELPFERGGNGFAITFRQYKTKYCPNCGAEMRFQEEVKNYPPYLDRPKKWDGE